MQILKQLLALRNKDGSVMIYYQRGKPVSLSENLGQGRPNYLSICSIRIPTKGIQLSQINHIYIRNGITGSFPFLPSKNSSPFIKSIYPIETNLETLMFPNIVCLVNFFFLKKLKNNRNQKPVLANIKEKWGRKETNDTFSNYI